MLKFLGGSAEVDAFAGDQLIFSAKTLSDSGITISSSSEDVRGGPGNQLYGKYFHTSMLDVALTDVLFDLNYLALQTGGDITNGAEMFEVEQVTITANAGTIVKTPIAIDGEIKGWVQVLGETVWTKVTFNGQNFDYTAPDGTIVCVKFQTLELQARSFVISSNIIPKEVKLVLRGSLFRAGSATSQTLDGSSLIGNAEFIIPRFLFNGSMELSMTSSGVSNSQLNGSALAIQNPSCSAVGGYYAIVNEKLFGDDVYSNVIALAIDGGSDIDLAAAETANLLIYAIPSTGGSFVIDKSLLTFTSADEAVATVTTAGVITAVATGETKVDVVLTSKSAISAGANVTVS